MGDQVVTSGGFAVEKSFTEDRWIAPMKYVNSIVDGEKLDRPRMPYLPQLQALTVPEGVRVRVSKRDAKHYFHTLRAGARWRPFR